MNQSRSPDPLYAGPRQGGYNTADPRNGGSVHSNGGSIGNSTADSGSVQNRAEKFDNEKKRIIESCFAKRDTDGSLLESYITHVRVVEDGQYPSSPPPPDSAASNKKSRVILVAVRKSGRVRVHKARENPSGSFSIGKTWPLDELNAIQSYTGIVASSTEEHLHKQWASSVGFMVTLVKPYYWQASTSKEKDFFIMSLVKIFRKYTGGKIPDLLGFTSAEIEVLRGVPGSRALSGAQSPPSQTPSITSSPAIPVIPDRAQSSFDTRLAERDGERQPSRDPSFGTEQQEYRPQTRDGQRKPMSDTLRSPPTPAYATPIRNGTQAQSRDGPRYLASPETPPVKQPRHEPVPPFASHLQAPVARPAISEHSSHSSLQSGSQTSILHVAKPNGLVPPPLPNENGLRKLGGTPSFDSMRTKSETEPSISSRPSTAVSERKTPEVRHDQTYPPEQQVSERMRPLDLRPQKSFGQQSARSEASHNFSTPLDTPSAMKSEAMSQQPPSGLLSSATILLSAATTMPSQPSQRSTDYFNSGGDGSTSTNKDSGLPQVETSEVQPGQNATIDSSAPAISQVTAESEQSSEPTKAEEEHRPGLGPMVKKKSAKDIASTFRKAALAASAFQPRQGGAGARLKALQQQEKTSNEPDGITSVVPAPLFRGISTDSARSATSEFLTPLSEKDRPFTPVSAMTPPKVQIQRTATEDSLKTPPRTPTAVNPVIKKVRTVSPEKTRSRSPARRRRQRQEADVERYCSSLGLDPRIVDGRGAEFNDLLTEFGWDGKLNEDTKIETFEADLRREIGRAQATGWLGHIEQQESKVQELAKAFERAIEECEELDGLLTLYSHELDTLHDDIQYIEAQSQGLQVQTANQKLLQNELHGLLKTLNISPADLRGLHSGSFDTSDGVQEVEQSLSILYQAMITIDPDIRQNKVRQEATSRHPTGVGVYADAELGQMRAVREKKDDYREETLQFLKRFNQYMTYAFKRIEQRNSEDTSRSTTTGSSTSLDVRAHNVSRQEMWIYNAILLFVREVNSYEWQTLITSYEMNIKSTYTEQFRDNVMSRKKVVRKPPPEDQDILFTTQEKEKIEEGLASHAARKLTVKRGKTLKASALRRTLGEKKDGMPEPWEIFETVLQQQAKVISEEQNFVVHFFHLNSQSNLDFSEIIAARPPQQRKLPNLGAKQTYDPDRNMAKIVQQVIDSIYSFWPTDMQGLLEWCLKTDHLQGIGMMCSIEQCLALYEETNQEYITRTLRTLHERLTVLFHKFIDEQVKAIEETKVKVKKRKGIISFMRTFPLFSAAVEAMIPTDFSHHESLEVRFIVNDAYTKILKAMWESLNFIAKDDPAATRGAGAVALSTAPASGDPEDKEALNYHVLLIENMNHYIEEVDAHHNVVLEEWSEKATHDLFSHLSQYTDAVIRRPLGKWLDFLESTEALMKSTENMAGISAKPSHSRSAVRKVLGAYDAREVRKGVETLKKRIEKHFGDVEAEGHDGGGGSKGLIGKVYDESASRYAHAWDRMKAIVDRVYEGNLEIEWRKEDVVGLFKR